MENIQNELKSCAEELHASKEISKALASEKLFLEQKILRLEKKKKEEVSSLSYDQSFFQIVFFWRLY